MNIFLRFSTQRVENLNYYYHGLIIVRLFKNLMKMRGIGMSMRLPSRTGAFALFSAISVLNIIIACLPRNEKTL